MFLKCVALIFTMIFVTIWLSWWVFKAALPITSQYLTKVIPSSVLGCFDSELRVARNDAAPESYQRGYSYCTYERYKSDRID